MSTNFVADTTWRLIQLKACWPDTDTSLINKLWTETSSIKQLIFNNHQKKNLLPELHYMLNNFSVYNFELINDMKLSLNDSATAFRELQVSSETFQAFFFLLQTFKLFTKKKKKSRARSVFWHKKTMFNGSYSIYLMHNFAIDRSELEGKSRIEPFCGTRWSWIVIAVAKVFLCLLRKLIKIKTIFLCFVCWVTKRQEKD